MLNLIYRNTCMSREGIACYLRSVASLPNLVSRISQLKSFSIKMYHVTQIIMSPKPEWQLSSGHVPLPSKHHPSGAEDPVHRGTVRHPAGVHHAPPTTQDLSAEAIPDQAPVSASTDSHTGWYQVIESVFWFLNMIKFMMISITDLTHRKSLSC